jgi:hypothetical protein
MSQLRKTLIEDMERMEQAAVDLTLEHQVSLGKILYWCCVAQMHVIQWVLRREAKQDV